MIKVENLCNTSLAIPYIAKKTVVGKYDGNNNPCPNIIIRELKDLIQRGHFSVLEHINHSFLISNISRGLLQQLVRHRHCAFTVESTRTMTKQIVKEYIKGLPEDVVDSLSFYGFPNDFKNEEDINKIRDVVFDIMEKCRSVFDALNKHKNFLKNDNLKYFIPEFVHTKVVMTTNARELRHMFKLRSNPPAMKEFNDLMECIFNSLPEEYRFLYEGINENNHEEN